MRAFQITAIVFSLILLVVAAVYADQVRSERFDSLFNDYGSYTYFSSGNSTTTQAAMVCSLFVLFFTAVQILSIIKIKTTTMKVMGIIGACLSGILLLIGVLVMANPGSLSFDEAGAFWALYAIIMIAFSIVGTVHAFRKAV